MSNWECGVCGYVHKEDSPPEKCPVCEAPAKMFKEVKQEEKEQAAPPAEAAEKRWRCTVCGYIHTGPEPPENCPVCDAPKNMFVEIDAEGKALGEPEVKEPEPVEAVTVIGKEKSSSVFGKFIDFSLKHHLHPITVHFPNGIVPAIVIFLALALYFNSTVLETAAYCNLVFVLVMLPLVLLTGFIEWRKRYKGIKTAIFITKITCSLIVLALACTLVFWRLINPGVVEAGSPSRLIYLGIAVALLAVVGFAGLLGGKLLFGRRG